MKKIFLLAAVALSVSGYSQQQVSNKLKFKKGQKLEMVTKATSTVTMEMMGQSMDTKIDATITRSFDVEDVSANGSLIEHKMKRMQMNFESPMAGSQAFDSENEKDMAGEGGKALEKALKNKYTLTVDETGKIKEVKPDAENPNKPGVEDNDMMSDAIGQVGEGMGLPKAGDKFEFRILPEKAVAKGETWKDSSANGLAVYTLTDITEDHYIVDYVENNSIERTTENQGMEIKISSKEETNGKIIVDRATGIMKEKTSTTTSEGVMEMMGQSMPLSTKVQRTVTITSK